MTEILPLQAPIFVPKSTPGDSLSSKCRRRHFQLKSQPKLLSHSLKHQILASFSVEIPTTFWRHFQPKLLSNPPNFCRSNSQERQPLGHFSRFRMHIGLNNSRRKWFKRAGPQHLRFQICQRRYMNSFDAWDSRLVSQEIAKAVTLSDIANPLKSTQNPASSVIWSSNRNPDPSQTNLNQLLAPFWAQIVTQTPLKPTHKSTSSAILSSNRNPNPAKNPPKSTSGVIFRTPPTQIKFWRHFRLVKSQP